MYRAAADVDIPGRRVVAGARDRVLDLPPAGFGLAGGVRSSAPTPYVFASGMLMVIHELLNRFDIVKIDLSLVQEGAERASSRAVLRSLRDLAGRWGAFVIAEGIETAEMSRLEGCEVDLPEVDGGTRLPRPSRPRLLDLSGSHRPGPSYPRPTPADPPAEGTPATPYDLD